MKNTHHTPKTNYSTGIAKLTNSAPYRYTLGAAVDTRLGRIILLGAVPLIWILFMHVGPILQMFKISLMAVYPPIPGQEGQFTLANYAIFFSDPLYKTPLMRSFAFAATATFATLIVVYPVAYYVAKVVRPEGRSKALLLLLIPFWAGELIRIFSIIMLLANKGGLNVLLMNMGLIDRPIPMLYTAFSLGFGLIYMICLYMLLPLYSALEKIPSSLLDAAADLGAGPLTRFFKVILPLSKDGIVSGCSLVFLACMGAYAAPILLGGSSTALFSETISSFFHTSSSKWPVGAAFAMLMLAVSLTTAGLFMRVVGGTKRSSF